MTPAQNLLAAKAKELANEFTEMSKDDTKFSTWMGRIYNKYNIASARFETLTGVDRIATIEKKRVSSIIMFEARGSMPYDAKYIESVNKIRPKYEGIPLTRENFPAPDWNPQWEQVWFGDDRRKAASNSWMVATLSDIVNEGTAPPKSDPLTPRAFLQALYRFALRRNGQAEGLQYWESRLVELNDDGQGQAIKRLVDEFTHPANSDYQSEPEKWEN